MANKIEHRWSILCKSTSVDRDTNEMSLLGLVDEINVDAKMSDQQKEVFAQEGSITVQMGLIMVSLWERIEKVDNREAASASIEMALLDPSGEELKKPIQYTIEIPKDKVRLRQRTKIENMSVSKSGFYKIVLYKKEDKTKREKIAEIPIKVRLNIS